MAEPKAELNRIKVALVERHRSNKWLAEQLGKSTCSVSKWCTNTCQPDLQTLNQIADVLDLDPRELIKGKDIIRNTKD